jgi:hypothetical protein
MSAEEGGLNNALMVLKNFGGFQHLRDAMYRVERYAEAITAVPFIP